MSKTCDTWGGDMKGAAYEWLFCVTYIVTQHQQNSPLHTKVSEFLMI